jgi:predicted dinucleotide-binding enzyme
MKIAILGAGHVGETLGKAYLARGHQIYYAVKNPQDPKHQTLLQPGATVGKITEAVDFADIIFLCLPWGVVQRELEAVQDFQGKILVDCTLPIAPDFSGLTIGHTGSGAEQVATWAKNAKVCKTLGQVGFETMADAKCFSTGTPLMLVCGADLDSRKTVVGLINELGFEGLDIGELTLARLLEPYGFMWVHLAFKVGLGREFAFGLLRK